MPFNPRTPEAFKAAATTVSLRPSRSGGLLSRGDDIERLKKDYPPSKHRVLHLTNVPEVDVVSEVLSTVQRAAFVAKFGFVGGSWCCAPSADSKKGQPMSAHFSLMRAGSPPRARPRRVG